MSPKTYLVGGAVRDKLMGREAKDRDYVVVGMTPEGMIQRGFKQVGADFPVFLHPESGEEYALARTHGTQDGQRLQRIHVRLQPERHSRRRPQASRPHDQCNGCS